MMTDSPTIIKSPLKIGFLLLSEHSGRGGLERVLIDIVTGLKNHKVESYIYALHQPDFPEFIETFDHFSYVKIADNIKNRSRLMPKFIHKLIIKKHLKLNISSLFQKMENDEIDALLVLNLSKLFSRYYPKIRNFKESTGTPILSWAHETLSDTPEKIMAQIKQKISLFDAHLAISQGIADEIKQFYLQENTFITYNPITAAEIIPYEKGRFIYIGRIEDNRNEDNKRVFSLIQQLNQLKGEWQIEVIGSTGNEVADQEFMEKVNRLENGHRVHFHGWQEKPWNVVKSASTLLLNSRKEGFSLVIAEAMMRGLSVVSTDCPVGPSEIIQEGVNGWLYDRNSEAEGRQILQNILDGTLPIPNQKTVQLSVQRFEKDRVVENFYQILSKIIEK